jgi:carbamoyl-phosphate synthase small subunit
MADTAYLILENGKTFKGKSFGCEHEVTAEIVFTTGMTGYLETLTDKSYFGQIVVQTFPLIGNYGVIAEDFESGSIMPEAYIIKYGCRHPSNFRSGGTLDTFLKEQNITGLYDIDTRALTKTIREHGVMNGKISKSPAADLDEIKRYRVENALARVSTKEPYLLKSADGKYKIAVLDFGMNNSIANELLKRGCDLSVFPFNTETAKISAIKPDGILLSNGPGNPAENTQIIHMLQELLKTGIPVFGIGLGHQLLALANGFVTEKLKYGHRGANQPVKDLSTNKVYISGQNHGYAVVSSSIAAEKAKELFVNVNDLTNEGIEYLDCPVFSVQFQPGVSEGLADTAFLFDRFISMLEGKGDAIRSAY